jgi:hypothetical protein
MTLLKRNLANDPLTTLGAAVDEHPTYGDVPTAKIYIGAESSFALLAFGQATKANSLPVVLASDQGSLGTITVENTVVTPAPTNGTVSSTAVEALAANASRVMGWIQAIDGDLWVNAAGTAAIDTGTYVPRGSSFPLHGHGYRIQTAISIIANAGTVKYSAVEG